MGAGTGTPGGGSGSAAGDAGGSVAGGVGGSVGGAAGGTGASGLLGGLLAGKGLGALLSGVLVGAVGGGAIVANGVFGPATNPAPAANQAAMLALLACPGSGAVLARVPSGQPLLATGRSSDGTWVQIYLPEPGIDRAWVPGSALNIQGDAASLPVVACSAPAAPASPPGTPTATPTELPATAQPTPPPATPPLPTPSPTASASPTPTPSATAKPNAGPPALTGLKAAPATLSTGDVAYCPQDPRVASLSVTANDPDGIAKVVLYYRPPGASSYSSKPMSGPSTGGTWTASLSTAADGIKAGGTLAYYVAATDGAATPATTRLPRTGTQAVKIKVCANAGPQFTLLSSDSSTVDTDPFKSGTCSDALGTGITASATDSDGVKSLTLFFTGPGLAGTTSRLMNQDGANWYSFINPTDDGITGSGTISWWIVAADSKGATTKSATQSITVVRCDAPAAIRSSLTAPNGPNGPAFIWCENATTFGAAQWLIYATDPDNGSTPLQVTLAWTLTNLSRTGGGATTSDSIVALYRSGNNYTATIPSAVTTSWYPAFYGANSLTWTVTTVDQYGGTSQSKGSSRLSISSC